eukprot:jgi/Hompol1/4339/HPOL_003602-RA
MVKRLFDSISDSDSDTGSSKRQTLDQPITELGGETQENAADKRKLVIPLIAKNIWRNPESNNQTTAASIEPRNEQRPLRFGLQQPTKRNKQEQPSADAQPSADEDASAAAPLSLEQEAINAILSESNIHDNPLPILAQNAVPGQTEFESDTDKFRNDVSMRPSESTLEDYERIPVESFGDALLRGMGWSEGKGIGKGSKGPVTPVIPKPRPYLLGLGATPAPAISDEKPKGFVKPGEQRSPDAPPKPVQEAVRSIRAEPSIASDKVEPGTLVRITAGRNAGKTGKVVDIKEKSSGIAVKIALADSNDFARVWIDEVERLDSNQPKAPVEVWLRPNIRVRIISKSLLNKRVYNKKATVEDIARIGECTLRLDDSGEILEDVPQKYLETVIPSTGKSVVVVSHPNRSRTGHTAVLLEKNHDKSLATIQFDSDFTVETLAYDQISEFIE